MAKSNKAYVYRLYPTTEQQILLARTFGCCRKVYNEILSHNTSLHDDGEKMLSKTAANNYCNRVLKGVYPYLREVDKFALTNSIYALYNGYDSFFKKLANFPRFKSKHKARRSYTTNITNNNIAVLDNAVKLPKLGQVKAKVHRIAPIDWELKSATISADNDGRYYVSILYEYEQTVLSHALNANSAIGLDYKPSCLYADSLGDVGGMPKYTKASSDCLALAQRKLAKKVGSKKHQQQSNNYKKQKRKVNKIHKHIANQRKDFLHKKSFAIAKQYDYVCIQEECISDKVKSRPYKNYRKSVYDCGWHMFTKMLTYKQAERGHMMFIVDKNFASTQICSVCGFKNDDLAGNDSIRKWECPCCHAKHDRDTNAARNILKEGLRQFA